MLLDTKLICRNLLCIYTKSEISEIKIKETLQYSIASKKKKYLGINLQAKDLYSENSKVLMKVIEDDTSRMEKYVFLYWKNQYC